MPERSDELDCLVIGAGPAGLTAAIYLARFRRDFRVVDAGESRAGWNYFSHNHAGFPDGILSRDLLARMRAQAERYGARIESGEVDRLERLDDGFVATIGERNVRARTVLMATGGVDVEPELPGLGDAIRRGFIRHCPICDAYEVIDRKVALIGYGKCRVREAMLLRNYTADLTVLTLGKGLEISDEERATLEGADIRILDEPVSDIEIEGDRIAVWRSSGGAEHRFDTLYTALGCKMRSSLAQDLGAEADEDGALIVDEHQRTSVPCLYAAGDVVRGLSQISVGMGQAAIAATDINRAWIRGGE